MLHLAKNFSISSTKNTVIKLFNHGKRTSHQNPIRNHSGAMKVAVIGAAGLF